MAIIPHSENYEKILIFSSKSLKFPTKWFTTLSSAEKSRLIAKDWICENQKNEEITLYEDVLVPSAYVCFSVKNKFWFSDKFVDGL